QGKWLAVKVMKEDFLLLQQRKRLDYPETCLIGDIPRIKYLEDVFLLNEKQIAVDIEHLKLQKSVFIDYQNSIFYGDDLYLHDSIQFEQVTLDTRTGPVYVEEDVIIEPGVIIKGPAYIGKGSRLKSGTVIYPNVTIGPNCTIS